MAAFDQTATLAVTGEIELLPAQTIVTVAEPDLEASAVLVAETVTVGGFGMVEGAV